MKLLIRYWLMKIYFNRMLWAYEERFLEYPPDRFQEIAFEAALAKFKLNYYTVDGYFVVYTEHSNSRKLVLIS